MQAGCLDRNHNDQIYIIMKGAKKNRKVEATQLESK